MSMIKKVTLTINKNNTGVKLSSPLKFFKYDSFLLQCAASRLRQCFLTFLQIRSLPSNDAKL